MKLLRRMGTKTTLSVEKESLDVLWHIEKLLCVK